MECIWKALENLVRYPDLLEQSQFGGGGAGARPAASANKNVPAGPPPTSNRSENPPLQSTWTPCDNPGIPTAVLERSSGEERSSKTNTGGYSADTVDSSDNYTSEPAITIESDRSGMIDTTDFSANLAMLIDDAQQQRQQSASLIMIDDGRQQLQQPQQLQQQQPRQQSIPDLSLLRLDAAESASKLAAELEVLRERE